MIADAAIEIIETVEFQDSELRPLIDKYMNTAAAEYFDSQKLKDGPVVMADDVEGHIRRTCSENGSVFLIQHEGKTKGFFTLQVGQSDYLDSLVFLNYFYIEPEIRRNRKLIEDSERIFTKWAADREAKNIYFTTRKNPRVMKRFMPHPGWEVDSVVFKRKIKEVIP